MKCSYLSLVFAIGLFAGTARPADNLRLKPHLDYMKNSLQGPVIEGDKMWDGLEPGKPNIVFMYAEFCFDAKRQALRTVELYRNYGDRFHFVVIDLSRPIARVEQVPLVKKYFTGNFPHTTILDAHGKVILDYTGEIDDATLIGWMDTALRSGSEQVDTANGK